MEFKIIMVPMAGNWSKNIDHLKSDRYFNGKPWKRPPSGKGPSRYPLDSRFVNVKP